MMDGDYQNDTPPTLGKLIRDAAMDHSIQPPCSDGSRAAWRELRRLTELSDACERLAKAAADYDTWCAGLTIDPNDPGDTLRSMLAGMGRLNAALAAYREAVARG